MTDSKNYYSGELLSAVFSGMCADGDEIVYFDKKKLNVFHCVEGYFNSMIGDLAYNKRILAQKIMTDAPQDTIDDYNHIQLEAVNISTFLEEYQQQANGKEPFASFVEDFKAAVISQNFKLTSKFDFYFSDMFTQVFSEMYPNRVQELSQDYSDIFESTCRALALKWIESNT